MAKDYTCWDCGYYGGRHEPTCPRKGYLNPSAPKAPAAPAPVRVECPCGIHREDCDYHRPSAAPTYEYGAYDAASSPRHRTGRHDICACLACVHMRTLKRTVKA